MRLLDELASDARARTMLLITMLGAALLLRAASLGTYPLMDTTEARYGDIARVMLETGRWLTPQEAPGVAFWAKPPLVAWLSAASMAVLGVNEFAARLPSLLFALVTCWLVFGWARDLPGRDIPAPADPGTPRERGLVAVALLATSVLFYVCAGTVMTDPGLACLTTWILAAFHRCVVLADGGARGPVSRWGLFVAAGLAMLAKGPVVLVYAGLPIVAWALWSRRLRATWQALPWVRGGLLFVALWLPWYLAAEMRTPGFLRYFVLGEHLGRFLEPGWHGDLYGRAHPGARGAIWIYVLIALGPWVLLLWPARRAAGHEGAAGVVRASRTFLLLCAVLPLLVFTFSRNLLWTYALPVLAPIAVLLAQSIERHVLTSRRWRIAFVALLPLPLATFAVGSIAWLPAEAERRSPRALVATWRQETQTEPGPLLYWGPRMPHSLSFYSAGRATRVYHDVPLFAPGNPIFMLVETARVQDLTVWMDGHLPGRIVELLAGNDSMRLLEISAPADRGAGAPGPDD